ncbi:MAG: hypothetical protein JSW68_08185 [Burkholderiales bacterium]|nr:MAG: hypothetical protein JSW68_08185 [Burkholderiales bacterium]
MAHPSAARDWRIGLRRAKAILCQAVVIVCLAGHAAALTGDALAAPPWHGRDAAGRPTVLLYYFWKADCPYCKRANPFLEELRAELPWLELRSHLLTDRPDNETFYRQVTRELGQEAPGVPAFVYCATLEVGFTSPLTSGAFLRRGLLECRERMLTGQPATPEARSELPQLDVPLVGPVDPRTLSLPGVTVLLAALDGLNPCTFFVLMFLLSLLVHGHDRGRMALVAGTYVLSSALVYFAYMAAWLSMFVQAGELRWITLLAGLIAITLAAINIKDYFLLGRGPTLSMSGGARARMIDRMRRIVLAGSLPAVLGGTVTLAIAANTYGLLCTAGFPMLFTRLLTLEPMSTPARYGLLVLYNAVHVLPLVALAAVFMLTLGSRKLQREEGRVLKLFSGLMMVQLGILLLARPNTLDELSAAAGVIAVALSVTVLVHWLLGRRFGKATD